LVDTGKSKRSTTAALSERGFIIARLGFHAPS
jgi:hypothetical protein